MLNANNQYKEEFKRLLDLEKKRRVSSNLKARNEDIAKDLGYNRSYLSQLTGSRGAVTIDHLKSLVLNFPWLGRETTMLDKMLENVTRETPTQPQDGHEVKKAQPEEAPTDRAMAAILALVESNGVLAESNRILGIANQNLTESNLILSRSLRNDLNKGNPLIREAQREIYMKVIYELGVGKGKRWKDKDEADGFLSNLLDDKLWGGEKAGKKPDLGKKRKG